MQVAGFLLEKEIRFLKGAVDAPKRPFAAIVGGAKVSTKIPVIESLIQKCDKIFIGGGMIFTFYRAQGLNVGKSMVEEEFIATAKDLMDKAAAKGVKLILPSDVIVADDFKADAKAKQVRCRGGGGGGDARPPPSSRLHSLLHMCAWALAPPFAPTCRCR